MLDKARVLKPALKKLYLKLESKSQRAKVRELESWSTRKITKAKFWMGLKGRRRGKKREVKAKGKGEKGVGTATNVTNAD